MKKCIRLAVGVTLSAAFGLGSQVANAQTNAVATGNWNTAGTWSAGVPTDTSPAIINGGFNVTLDQAGQLTNLVDVGTISGQTGTITFAGGDLTVFDSNTVAEPNTTAIRLGQAAGATGNLSMTAGQVFISEDIPNVFDSGDLVVGQSGTGTATVSGGTLTAADEIILGQNAGASGTVTVSGGTLAAGRRNIQIGFAGADAVNAKPGGQGVLNVSGTGQLTVGDTIFMGFGGADTGAGLAGGNGDLNISGSAVVNVTGWVQSAFGNDSTSHITQSGGTVTVGGLLVHGARGDAIFDHTGGSFQANLVIIGDGVDNTTPHGTYNISNNAQMKSNLVMWVGAWGKGEGTVNQSGSSVVNVGALTVGRDGYGIYNMSGGTLNSNGTDGYAPNDHLIIGQVGNVDDTIAKGAGVFTQTGGTVVVKTGVFLGDFDHSEGTYKISGGSLTVGGGSHPNVEGYEDFIGDFSVGGALASNALVARTEPANSNDPQGQALAASGTFIVSGSAATINIAGNFLANPADKSALRRDPTNPGGSNSATLGFEIFNSTGTSLINVGGAADLDGAVIDLDLMSGYVPAINQTFDLLKASSFGATGTGTTQNVGTGMGWSLAAEDVGGWNLAVITSGVSKILRATFLGLPGLPGDFNNDGKVDGRDFLAWQRGNSPNPLSSGDLALWQSNYGTGSLAAIGSVPEPSSAILLGALGLLPCIRRTKRS